MSVTWMCMVAVLVFARKLLLGSTRMLRDGVPIQVVSKQFGPCPSQPEVIIKHR